MNDELGDLLLLIAKYYQSSTSEVVNKYKASQYLKAGNAIKKYKLKITSGAQAKKNIPGIGDKIAIDIDEYIKTGKIKKLENFRADKNLKNVEDADKVKITNLFRGIHGVGPVAAEKLYKLGYRSLEELLDYDGLTSAQKQGLIWYNDINMRIPRSTMDKMHTEFETLFNGLTWSMNGSYRRGLPSSGDIDILVISDNDEINMNYVVDKLEPILAGVLAQGKKSLLHAIIQFPDDYGHRLDVRIVTSSQFPFAQMYFTGSKEFNVLMRLRAASLDYKLSEYSLINEITNKSLNAKNEKDIFKLLGVKYLTPAERTNDLTELELV